MITRISTGPLGVNTYIVSLYSNLVLIVDPACCAFSGDDKKFISYLKTNELVPAAVYLTHAHFDHVAGLLPLKKEYPALPVIIHKDDGSLIGRVGNDFQTESLLSMGFDSFIPFVTDLPEPTALVEDGDTLDSFISSDDEKLKSALKMWTVIHTPGHTKGSSCLYNKSEKLLISGDTVFYHSYGRTDLPGGSESEIVLSLNKLYENLPADTLVYPGHENYGFPLSKNL